MSALKTLAALRALEAVALYPECTLHPELARTLLDAWGARERELRRVIAERDRVTAERDAALERGVQLGRDAAARVVNHAGGNRVQLEDLERDIRTLDPAAIIAAAREREAPAQETAATNVIGDVWRTPWGHDQVVTAVGSNGFLSFGRDPVGTEHMLRCAGWAPKKARRSLKSVMDEVAAEITPAERELFDRNRAIEERMRAQETAGEAPHAVGDRVRVVRRGWCGSTLYEGEEGELVYVDHDDPSHPFFVKATDGDGRWSGGWVAEVESAEQPGTAEPGGE